MKVIISFIFVTTLALMSLYSAAAEQETDQLAEVMASLKKSYGWYNDLQGNQIPVPAFITNEYQSLISTPDLSDQDKANFIKKMQQNIADFNSADEVASETNQIYDFYEMQLLRLGLKLEMPANIKAIDNTYRSIIESENFIGADILDFEKRYQAALKEFTKDGIDAFADLRELQLIAYTIERNSGELTEQERANFELESKTFFTVANEVEELTQQQKWSAANKKIPHATTLGNQLSAKIKNILDNHELIRNNQRNALLAQYESLYAELNEKESIINKLANKIESYLDELDEPCENIQVDFSCASRCPDQRVRDPIFGYYKNEPNYQCLSHCNNAESKQQRVYDEELAECIEEKEYIESKAYSTNDKRESVIAEHKRLVRELTTLEAKLRGE